MCGEFFAGVKEPLKDSAVKSFADTGVSKRDMIRLSHSMRSLDFTSELKKVSCPVAIVCGEKDNANQKAARQLGRDDCTAIVNII